MAPLEPASGEVAMGVKTCTNRGNQGRIGINAAGWGGSPGSPMRRRPVRRCSAPGRLAAIFAGADIIKYRVGKQTTQQTRQLVDRLARMLVLNRILSRLPASLGSLRERFDTRPISSIEALTHFVHTRSAYVAQTSLHGYLKARMGTSFRYFFTDDEFSRSIRIASINVFLSCLADLTIFAVATAARGNGIDSRTAAVLAEHCYRDAASRCLDPRDWSHVQDDPERRFVARATLTNWQAAAEGENAFSWSPRDLVRMAPVVDEYKQTDEPIVTNSIRFRWQDVRRQFRKRAEPASLWEDWERIKAEGGLDSEGPARYHR